MATTTDGGRDGPPRALLIAAVGLAVAAIVTVLAIAAVRQLPEQLQPVPIATVPAPKSASPECTALLAALPDQLGDYRRAVVDTTNTGVAAWQTSPDAEPVILRCGLDRPPEFVVGAPLQIVEPVQWFELTDGDRSTWFAVDRPVYIALTLPSGSGPTPIQEISEAIAKVMPAKPLEPGAPR